METKKRVGWGKAEDAWEINSKMCHRIYRQLANIQWESHPLCENVKLAYILTKEEDSVDVTCIFAKIPKGSEIPEHVHKDAFDIICPLSGRGKIWIKGVGEFELKCGVVVNVPPGALHKVYDVTEDMEIYDVFNGAIA